MSTTDRAAFEQYAESQGCRDFEYDQDDSQRYRNPFTQREYKYWRAALDWQAATEAAKATGTAGEPEIRCFVQDGKAVHTLRGLEIIGGHIYEVSAARQPAPVAIKTWQERMKTTKLTWKTGDGKLIAEYQLMTEEIADLRAALAATAAPVLSDEQINDLWNSLPGIEIHNKAYAQGMSTDYALRIAFAKAILAATNRSQP